MKKISLLLSILVTLSISVNAETNAPLLTVKNDFVKIVVNNDSQETGRFALETTGGNPSNPKDDDKPLIYGRPKPWTSYSTLLIDGQSYVFGGPTKKRAGKSGKFGQVLSQTVVDNKIVTQCKFDALIVTQTLALFNNPISAAKDAVLIEYQIENKDVTAHKVGTRVMLDTMLGDNDGAPFRIGSEAIEAEKIFTGSQILPFWQAFDDLASPNVVAQGILSSDEIELTKPEKMALVNWGTLADNPWNVPFESGRSFNREGENVPDTALALYWPDLVIPAGGKRVIRTAYGLGGLSISAGEMRLGLTAPVKMFGTQSATYLVVGYVQNAGTLTAKNSVATFVLPEGTEILSGASTVNLGNLKPGQSAQIPLTIRVSKVAAGPAQIVLKIDSDNLKDNQLTRNVLIVNPAQFDIRLAIPKTVSNTDSPYFLAEATLKNNENTALNNVSIALGLSNNAAIASFDIPVKKIDSVPANSTATLNWMIKSNTASTESVKVSLTVSGPEINAKTVTDSSIVAPLSPTYRLAVTMIPSSNSGYVRVELMHPPLAATIQPALSFDSSSVEIESIVYPENVFNAPPETQNDQILFSPVDTKTLPQSIYLAKVRFKKVAQQNCAITLQINGKTVDGVTLTPNPGGSL